MALSSVPPFGVVVGPGPFQQHIAGFDRREHIIRHRLAQCKAVFDGEALDLFQHDAAGGNVVREKLFKHALRLLHDDGADTVAVDEADGDGLHPGEVLFRRRLLHPLLALQLLAQQ